MAVRDPGQGIIGDPGATVPGTTSTAAATNTRLQGRNAARAEAGRLRKEVAEREDHLERVKAKNAARRKAGFGFNFGKLGQKRVGTFEAPPPIKLPSRQGRAGAGGGLTALPKTKAELARDKAESEAAASKAVQAMNTRMASEIDASTGSATGDAKRLKELSRGLYGDNPTAEQRRVLADIAIRNMFTPSQGASKDHTSRSATRRAEFIKSVDDYSAGKDVMARFSGGTDAAGGTRPPEINNAKSLDDAGGGLTAATKALRGVHAKLTKALLEKGSKIGPFGGGDAATVYRGQRREKLGFCDEFAVEAIYESTAYWNAIRDLARSQQKAGGINFGPAKKAATRAAIDTLESELGTLSQDTKDSIKKHVEKIYGYEGVWLASKKEGDQ